MRINNYYCIRKRGPSWSYTTLFLIYSFMNIYSIYSLTTSSYEHYEVGTPSHNIQIWATYSMKQHRWEIKFPTLWSSTSISSVFCYLTWLLFLIQWEEKILRNTHLSEKLPEFIWICQNLQLSVCTSMVVLNAEATSGFDYTYHYIQQHFVYHSKALLVFKMINN